LAEGNSKKKKKIWLGKILKEHCANRFVDLKWDRCALAFNIILFAQKEIIFVKEKLLQTM